MYDLENIGTDYTGTQFITFIVDIKQLFKSNLCL